MVGLHLSIIIVCYLCTIKQLNSIIVSHEEFNVKKDAEVLKNAMKFYGCNENDVIDILGQRSLAQRLKITLQYSSAYNENLRNILRSKLSGKYVKLIVSAMMRTVQNVFAIDLHDAIFRISINKEVLTEIMGTVTSDGMKLIVNSYESIYKQKLKDDLERNTSGKFKYLCVSLCTIVRDELEVYTDVALKSLSTTLYNNGQKRSETDKFEFITILVKHDYQLLRHVFVEYKKLASEDIEETIKREFSKGTRLGLLSLVKSIKDRDVYFAERLHDAMDSRLMNHNTVIRIIVTRSEIDIYEIKKTFKTKYNDSLESWITNKTSGLYQSILLKMVATDNIFESNILEHFMS